MIKRHRVETPGHMIGELFTFALFAMFLLLSLLIVVIGVDGYRGVVDAGESVGEVRTSLGYVAGKLRSDAGSDGVRIESRSGIDTLVLSESYQGSRYETVIYHMDGALYELYMNADDLVFEPEFGVRLTDVEDFDMKWEDENQNLLALTATTASGQTQTLHMAVRAEQEVDSR